MNEAGNTIDFCAETVPPKRSAMLIYDAELRERYGLDAEMMIDKMDRLPATQKGYATRPLEARYRPAVEEWLKANGHG